ncbi:MAG: Extracellular ligand-binding receptor [candidate division TM6 bacterium GW2011_GWF2_37_49]|nr:MAG: Extracellular ligand-binding receptor [candidate division TM6 bacterium GW2011_GWF2_37_49]
MKKICRLFIFYFVIQSVFTISTVPTQSQSQPQQSIDPLTKIINTPLVADKYEVAIGTSLPLKGEAAIMAQDILDGMLLYFNKMKQLQPPLKFFINLSALNDDSEIETSQINIDKLKQQTSLFLSLFGTNSTKCATNSLNSNEILSMFPIEGTSATRNQKLKNQIFLRADHESEINGLVKYLVETLNKKKIAIFYEESDWGKDALKSAIKILEEYNIKPEATASYQEKTVNISNAVKNIYNTTPAAIICLAQTRPAYNFICETMNEGLHKTTFAGLSNLYWIQKTLKESRGISVLLSSVVPNPFNSELAIVQEFRQDLKIHMPNKTISPFVLEGYLNASVFSAIIQATGFPLTLQNILKKITDLKKFKLTTTIKADKDMTFKLDQETMCLSKNRVWVNAEVDKKWKMEKGD